MTGVIYSVVKDTILGRNSEMSSKFAIPYFLNLIISVCLSELPYNPLKHPTRNK